MGHIYYFLVSVYPRVADIRGWSYRKILVTPLLLKYVCGEQVLEDHGLRVVELPLPQAPAAGEAGEAGDRQGQGQPQPQQPPPAAGGAGGQGPGLAHLHQE